MLPSDTTVSGDILMSTYRETNKIGAYTFAMASNYNRVPKSGDIKLLLLIAVWLSW